VFKIDPFRSRGIYAVVRGSRMNPCGKLLAPTVSRIHLIQKCIKKTIRLHHAHYRVAGYNSSALLDSIISDTKLPSHVPLAHFPS
jgi:hypothetical protein